MKRALFDEIDSFTPAGVRRNHGGLPINISDSLWKVTVGFIALLIVFLVFFARLIMMQVTQQDKYINLAKENMTRELTILPERGLIFDRNGEVLVRNIPEFALELNTLTCRLNKINDVCDQTLNEVEKYVVFDTERVHTALDNKRENILLKTDLTQKDILVVEANIDKMLGISVLVSPSREYPFGEEFSHVLGYVGLGNTSDSIVGKSGIEQYYNEFISGVPGANIFRVNSVGADKELFETKNSLPGKNVYTHLSVLLQRKAYELLKEKVENGEATGGAVIAQDPTNGGTIVLASYPAFDPNKLSSGITAEELADLNSDIRYPFFNRCISASYPPGSVYKMVVASAGLMEKVVTRFTTIFDPGYIKVGSFIFRNWKLDGHGTVNMKRALQVSNDTYFYTLGGRLGIAKMHDWALKFGFGSKTDIDLYGEVDGFIPDGTHRDWYLGDDYISAIGQGDILVTPLQINNMVSYFANGGYMYRSQIVKSIDGAGEHEPGLVARHIIDDEYYDLIREGMHASVQLGGTGYPLFTLKTPVAGKTGTAEFVGTSGKIETHAWFSVFAPYFPEVTQQANISSEDKPIVITVFLEGGGSGSDDAAPIARDLLDLWFRLNQR